MDIHPENDAVALIDFDFRREGFFAAGLRGVLEDYSSYSLHVHPFHQVLEIRNGVALLQDREGKRPQYGRMTAFIPAGVPHRTEVIGQHVEYQSLYLNEALFKEHTGSILIFRMSSLGLSLLDYVNDGEPLQDLGHGILKDCVELFVKVLVSDAKGDVRYIVLPEPGIEVAGALCRFMEENYRERLSAKDFSRAFPLSFRQLSRKFKSDMGLSIFEYLRLMRLLKASISLTTTDMKILSVIYESGYESVSSFFTDFRKVFGLSPAEFRRRHG